MQCHVYSLGRMMAFCWARFSFGQGFNSPILEHPNSCGNQCPRPMFWFWSLCFGSLVCRFRLQGLGFEVARVRLKAVIHKAQGSRGLRRFLLRIWRVSYLGRHQRVLPPNRFGWAPLHSSIPCWPKCSVLGTWTLRAQPGSAELKTTLPIQAPCSGHKAPSVEPT